MLLKIFLSTLLISSSLSCFAAEATRANTILLTEKQGIQMLKESEFSDAYWPLSQYYDSQINATYCGVASAVMVLNALDIPKPHAWPDDLYADLFTQENFFSEEVLKVVDHSSILKNGMTLEELNRAVGAWGVQTESIYATTLSEESLRDFLKATLTQTDRFIIANYHRPVIQGVYGGHFSPIAAYDQNTDSVLILDVYRHQFTGTWVKLSIFFKALHPVDSDSGLSRGLLLIQK